MSAKKKTQAHLRFEGFQRRYHKGFFTYPLEVLEHWHYLSGAEHKILDFILRQTLGYQKTRDTISIDQFRFGVGKRNRGTGLSRSQVRRALAGLEEKEFITVWRKKTRPSTIDLRLLPGENAQWQTFGEELMGAPRKPQA